MIKEKKYFLHYFVIELQRNGLFEYYLGQEGYGDLYFIYGVEKENFPSPVEALRAIQIAESCRFWK